MIRMLRHHSNADKESTVHAALIIKMTITNLDSKISLELDTYKTNAD